MKRASASVDERRKHERIPMRVKVVVKFVKQSKPYPVPVGKAWETTTVNCSRGGACLATPWPLARGDILDLELQAATPEGKTRAIQSFALVVNVHCEDNGAWTAGVRFIEDPNNPYG